MRQPDQSQQKIWPDAPPLPSDYIDFTETAISDLRGATIANTLAALPDIARILSQERDKRGLPGPAFISPHAIIGDDVYLGSGSRVYEFSTVRDGSIIDANAVIGFGTEVVRSYVGINSQSSHRNTLSASLIGRDVHFATGLTLASVLFSNIDMGQPTDEITVKMPDSTIYPSGTAKFGAVIGDGCRIGINCGIGPGVILGQDSVIGGLVRLTSGVYPRSLRVRDAGLKIINASSDSIES